MEYKELICGMERYGISKKDICVNSIGVKEEDIKKNVVIAPWWEPSIFPDFQSAEYISKSISDSIKVWNICNDDCEFTYIKTGIGASVLMDIVLALGMTSCKKIVFIGSVGALDSNIDIGDIVIPEYSVCGDGASRYIDSDNLTKGDIFGKKEYPDESMFDKSIAITGNLCKEHNVKWHIAKTFSIDTIFAQFYHLDEIMKFGCNVIEMETAAAFKAARLADISITAVFSVSDNTVAMKSLITGRTKEEMDYRRYTRRVLFPKIIKELFD
jgi:purine-nucleoside phosphorylase